MYFIFARTFDLVRSFFFFGNRSTTQNWPFPFLNTKWFKIGKKFVVEVVEITTETNVSELFFIFIVFYLYPLNSSLLCRNCGVHQNETLINYF